MEILQLNYPTLNLALSIILMFLLQILNVKNKKCWEWEICHEAIEEQGDRRLEKTGQKLLEEKFNEQAVFEVT